MKWALALLFLTGCCCPHYDARDVTECVCARIDKSVVWGEPCAFRDYLDQALLEKLTVQSAVQVALLNNPIIQSLLEDVGIAHADLIQAGLFRNPFFDLLVRFPDEGGFVTNIDYSIALNVLDIFLVPLRKRVARADLARVEALVTHAILKVAFDVEATFYSLVAEQERYEGLVAIEEILEGAYEIALAQANAGNIYLETLEKTRAESLSARMERESSALALIQLRRELQRLLGVSCAVNAEGGLFRPCANEPGLECLQAQALEMRLDLRGARIEVEKLARKGALKQWWVYTEAISGIASEREPEGVTVTGPAFGGSIPLFDYGQAARARLAAELRQSIDRYRALTVAILNEVGQSYEQMITLRQMITTYDREILPVQRELVGASQKLYNAMTLGPFDLIESKKRQYMEQVHYALALRDYWLARVELKRAIGGCL